MIANYAEPASKQIDALRAIELCLRSNPDWREEINHAVFGISNRMKVHPHDLAIYILIRTASI